MNINTDKAIMPTENIETIDAQIEVLEQLSSQSRILAKSKNPHVTIAASTKVIAFDKEMKDLAAAREKLEGRR